MDNLFLSFTSYEKKRLFILQKNNLKTDVAFFTFPELINLFKKNICPDIFANIDFLPEFPKINTFYPLSLISWINNIRDSHKYDEIYFILESDQYDRWYNTNLIFEDFKIPSDIQKNKSQEVEL